MKTLGERLPWLYRQGRSRRATADALNEMELTRTLTHVNLDTCSGTSTAKILLRRADEGRMKIQLHSLHGRAAAIQRSPEDSDWLHHHDGVNADFSLGSTNSTGWVLQCPYAFEATWNGGTEASAISIRSETPHTPNPSFAQSYLGDGLLTLHPGYQIHTADGHALWVRGPINLPKDGLYALEQIVDTSLFPCTVVLHVKFTRPNNTIRFEAGEPFCSILPYPKNYAEKFVAEVIGIERDLDAYERELQKLVNAPSVQRVMDNLSGAEDATTSERATTTDEVLFLPRPHVIPPPPPMAEEAVQGLFKETYPARISVILAASNESIFLRRTVEQFEATLPANSEIIVVDDGSTDGCADFLADRKRHNVHLIKNQIPLGMSEARNRGLTRARGEVVIFSDAHIDLPEHWWQPLVATLNRSGVGMVGPGLGVMGKPKLPVAYGQRIIEPALRLEWLFNHREGSCPVPALGAAFLAMHHDTLKQAGAFDATMSRRGSEALELCVRYWLLGYEVWVVPQVTVLCHFRKTPFSRLEEGRLTRDVLRLAFLYFNPQRIGSVVASLEDEASFHDALASAADSDVVEKRAAFAERSVRDDDWLFRTFDDECLAGVSVPAQA